MKTKKEIEFFRRSIGCGIKNKPPIFGKVWKYMSWINKIIINAPARDALKIKCEITVVKNSELDFAEKLSKKGPGILKETTSAPADQIQKVEKSVTKTFDMIDNKAFDVDVETLFNKL